MFLVENIIKVEKNNIKDFMGNAKKVSKITIGATALCLSLITANKIKNTGPINQISQEQFLGNCSLEVEAKTLTLEDVYINNCKKILKDLDSSEKSYILDDVLIDVIKKDIKRNKDLNSILNDENSYENLKEQIKITAQEVAIDSKKYESIYETVFTDNIEQCLGSFTLTSYCPCASCCGKSNGLTASGVRATANHTIAADKRFPFGTKLMINGTIYTVEDHGGAVYGNHIDVFYNTHSEALNAGTTSAMVYLIAPEEKKTMTR